jgi:hypothetical protein|tara:strand:- start:700 stop:1257 length:558 start_codon:yes stop_codon:yes gene_type:complete
VSVVILNQVNGMLTHQNCVLSSFGKDQTNLITYQFNQQGFRNNLNFNFVPDHAIFGCSLVFGIGVPDHEIFPSMFENSQNYGLAGNYDNHDVMAALEQFLSSDLYSKQTKIAVVWHSRDSECLEEFYLKLINYDSIVHFYCGQKLPNNNCYSYPSNLDLDVSGSHPGPRSHYMFYKMLCAIFNQL